MILKALFINTTFRKNAAIWLWFLLYMSSNWLLISAAAAGFLTEEDELIATEEVGPVYSIFKMIVILFLAFYYSFPLLFNLLHLSLILWILFYFRQGLIAIFLAFISFAVIYYSDFFRNGLSNIVDQIVYISCLLVPFLNL